jgi:hypothetical protein
MSRRPLRWLLGLVVALAGLRWIWNSNRFSGPVLLRLSATHGVHANDWLSLLAWGAAFVVVCPVWSKALLDWGNSVHFPRQPRPTDVAAVDRTP